MQVCKWFDSKTLSSIFELASETRRQAAADFTKALMEQFEAQITRIVTQYIGTYLAVGLSPSKKGSMTLMN